MTEYREVLARGVDRLLAQQQPGGYWYAPMYSAASFEADDLLLREFLGIRTDAVTERTARWLRHQQNADGSWPDYHGGPGNLSVTVEAYLALRIAGDEPSAPHMTLAAAYCRTLGGISAARTGTRLWLALLGQIGWESVPAILPEQIFTPYRSALSMYSLAAWTRIALVPLSIVSAHRPVHPLPFTVRELDGDTRQPASLAQRAFAAADGLMRRYQRRPLPWLRRRALRSALDWLLHHQEADGSWFGVHIMTAFGILALHALGHGEAHPAMKAALARLDEFGVEEQLPAGPARRVALCPGHVWDTALAVIALADGGLPADHAAMERAASWLLSQEATSRGDWALSRPALAPGGWSFAADARGYPDFDDTAAVLRALQLAGRPADSDEARRRGAAWLLGLQSRAGGWATYETGRVRFLTRLIASLPVNDFGPVLDPPWGGDLTGHVLETLGHAQLADSDQVRRAAGWLASIQEPDGSWYGRWGVNYVYGTAAAVVGLVRAGTDPRAELVRRAIGWLAEHQNPDGGWGEDCGAYARPELRGRGPSTASQTAWSLLAFHAAEVEAADPRVTRALDWLAGRQAADGSWQEDEYTGVGHPGELFFRYPLYPQAFPLMAIGRYLTAGSSSEKASREAVQS